MAVDDEDDALVTDEYKANEYDVSEASWGVRFTACTRAFRREIHQVLVLFLLFLLNIGYGYVENLVFAMPELTKSKSDGGMGLTVSEGSVVTAIADIGYVLGLFTTGPLADRFGGKRVLVITLLGSSIFNILCGLFDSVLALTVFYTLSMLCSAAAWPTSTTIIGNWFELDRQGRAFSVLSITWEIQYIITSLNLGLLLDFTGMGWRGLFVYSGGVSFVLCIAGLVFLRDTPPPDLAPPDSSLLDVAAPANYLSSSAGGGGGGGSASSNSAYSVDYSLFDENHVQLRQPSSFCGTRSALDDANDDGSSGGSGANSDDISHLEPMNALFAMVTSWHFWWMFFLMAFLTFAYEFTEWAPKFITDTIHTDSGNAAILSASAHLSALLSLMFGGVLVDKLSWTGASVYLVLSTGAASVLAAFLTAGTFYGFSTWWSLGLQQFLFGLAFTTPYYLPVSVYATRFGGVRYCATLAGFFDGFGYAVAILMDLTAGPLAENFSWSLVLVIVSFCCAISTVLMAVYQHSARPKFPFRMSDFT